MKLGFCFLVKEGLNHVSLWESFLRPIPPGSAGIYVHAKTPTPWPVLNGAWIDPAPLETAWGERSLVEATQRLFVAAINDGCDAMVLLSGDMLPLHPFSWIQAFCRQTRLALQPRHGLSERQVRANAERFVQIAPYFGLSVDQLRKQNMFFVIQREAICRIIESASVDDFPLLQLADEYYWVNHLIRIGAEWQSSNVVFCNSDPTRTQAKVMELTPALLESCRNDGYGFIRKITSLDDQVRADLQAVYESI